MEYKKLRIGKQSIQSYCIALGEKKLILLAGKKGYIMCGYLNLAAARKFGDRAAKITGVSSVADALRARLIACTPAARRIGLYKGQPVKEALRIIA